MIEGSCWKCLNLLDWKLCSYQCENPARFSRKSVTIATLCSSSLDW